MNGEIKEKLIKAGKIGRDALEYGKSIAEPGTLLIDIADSIEKFIMENGGKPSFPVNLAEKFGSLSGAIQWMRSVSHLIRVKPDLVIYLDVDPETAMKRISRRTDIPSGFEELEFLGKVREAYGIIQETTENVVDANLPMDETLKEVIELLRSKIRLL